MPVEALKSRITNLSFHDLSHGEAKLPSSTKKLLGLGFKFCPTPAQTQVEIYQQAFQSMIRNIRINYMFRRQVKERTYHKQIYVPNTSFEPPRMKEATTLEDLLDTTSTGLSSNLTSFIARKKTYNVTKEQQITLKDLSQSYELHFLHTDKNLGPAVMTHTQYVNWVLDHLRNTPCYKYTSSLPTKALIRMITTWHAKAIRKHIDKQKQLKIVLHHTKNCTTNKFYGMAKIHKNPMGLRPIVTSCNGPFHGLSKWIDFQLQPIVRSTKSFLQSSDELLPLLRDIRLHDHTTFQTWDATALYTSIPNKEGRLAIAYWLNKFNHPFKEEILDGLRIIMEYNWFSFGDTYWRQTSGTAMGTPCAPSYANLFLAYYEETVLLPMFKNNFLLYKRLIDDVLIIWQRDQHLPYAFNHFKAKLKTTFPGIKWTGSLSKESIDFLDLTIYRDKQQALTKTYQKSMNLYLYPTNNSAHPPGILRGLIFGLILKYSIQNSNIRDLQNMIKLLFSRLRQRGHPYELLRRHFLDAIANTEKRSLCLKRQKQERLVLYKIPYDPNGPTRFQLRRLLNDKALTPLLREHNLGKLTICFQRPPNLANKLIRAQVNTDKKPTPKEVVKHLGLGVRKCP